MDLSADHILVVFLLTTLAGLATGIGGFIAFFMKRTDTKTLTFALGLSGGVMVYISLVELLGEAQHRLIEFEGHTAGSWIAIASFFGGIAVAGLNILFILPVAVRRLHDSNLSGKFILIPILIFIVTFLLIFLLRLVPEDMAPYLDYLGMVSSLMDLLSILFLSMMLLKSSPGPNEYGVLPQKITVS